MTKSRIVPEFALDGVGKRFGSLRLFHSVHRSAYGFIPIPAGVICGGPGPTALLSAGNHGDEWEGQIVLSELLRELQPEQVRGRIIILPCLNLPASMAGTRTSPLDGGNLNRLFPGRVDGSVTEEIAHYVATELIPLADLVMDLHSGGSSLMYPTTCLASYVEGQVDDYVAAIRAFGLPYAYLQGRGDGQGGQRTLSATAEARGIMSISTELGGGGTVTRETLNLARAGVRRVLAHRGFIDPPAEAPGPTRILRMGQADDWTYTPSAGLFEPVVLPGDEVQTGQLAARIHTPETPWLPPVEVMIPRGGLVICRRQPGRTERGDCLFGVGVDY